MIGMPAFYKQSRGASVGDSLGTFLYESVSSPKSMNTEELRRALGYLVLTGNICKETYTSLSKVVAVGVKCVTGRRPNGEKIILGGGHYNPIEEGKKVVWGLCHDPNLARYGFDSTRELLSYLTLIEYPEWFVLNEKIILDLCPNALLWEDKLVYLKGARSMDAECTMFLQDVKKIRDDWEPHQGMKLYEKLQPNLITELNPKEGNPRVSAVIVFENRRVYLDLVTGDLFISAPPRHRVQMTHLEQGKTSKVVGKRPGDIPLPFEEDMSDEDLKDLDRRLQALLNSLEE